MKTPEYIGWEMNDLKRIKVPEHVQMAQASHERRMGCEATHIYCHASQIDLFDGMGLVVKALPVALGVINPGVFWMGIA